MKHTEEYSWSFAGTNYGKAIFRHDTNESLEDILKYLDAEKITYAVTKAPHMLTLRSAKGIVYSYHWNTGRWATFKNGSLPHKHYRATGIKDFITKFLLKDIAAPEETWKPIRDDIIEKVLTYILEAGEGGITASKVKEKFKYKERSWSQGVLQGSFKFLEKENKIFYKGDKEQGSRLIRHINYKENIYNETN